MLHELIELQAALVQKLEISLPISGVTIASNDKELMDDGTHLHLIPRQKDNSFWNHLELKKEEWSLEKFLDLL